MYLPHKANIYCTRKRALIAAFVTFVTPCIIHLDLLVHIQHVSTYDRSGNVQNQCWFKGQRFVWYTKYLPWINLIGMSAIPFVLLFIGNAMIICKVFKNRLLRKRMTSDTKSNDSMAAILISISVIFFVTQVPMTVMLIYRRNSSMNDKTQEFIHGQNVMFTVFLLLKWTNNAVNFFCYCISGKKFREEFVSVLKGLACKILVKREDIN